MKYLLLVFIGVVIFNIGLWGGSWLLNYFPKGSGYTFASFTSALITCAAGVALIIYALHNLKNR